MNIFISLLNLAVVFVLQISLSLQQSDQLLSVIVLTNPGIDTEGQIYPFMAKQKEELSYFQSDAIPIQLRQQEILGEKLRKLYIDKLQLLNSQYIERDVFVQCDQSPSSYSQVQSLMIGMFPFGSGNRIPDNINATFFYPYFNTSYQIIQQTDVYALPEGYQSIPFVKQDESNNTLFNAYNQEYCAQVKKWDDYRFSSKDWESVLKKHMSFLLDVKMHIQKKRLIDIDIGNMHDVVSAFNMLLEEYYYGVSESYFDQDAIYEMREFIFDYYLFRCDKSKLRLKVSLSNFLTQLYNILNTTSPKMLVYNINMQLYMNFMNMIGLVSTDCIFKRIYQMHNLDQHLDGETSANSFDNLLTGKLFRNHCNLVDGLQNQGSSLILEIWNETTSGNKYAKFRLNGQYVKSKEKKYEINYAKLINRLNQYIISKDEFNLICNGTIIE